MRPRRPGLLPALFVAATLALFFLPLLTGGQVYRRVTWRLLASCRSFLGEELRAGEFPGWYPFEQLGTPFHAQSVCGALHPLSWLSAFARPERVLAFQVLLGIAIAAAGAWLLARALGSAPAGCALASVSYALSGYLVSVTANVVFLWSAAHLPLQLAAFVAAARRGWSRGTLAGAVLATASSALMGDIQGAALFAAAAALAGLCLAPSRTVSRYLAGSGLAAGLSFGLAAPQLLPSLAFLPETARGAAGLPYAEAAYWSLHPLRLPELFLPAFSPIGAPGRAEHLLGSVPGMLLWADALGGSAVVSALALAALTARSVDRRVRLALGGLAILGLLLALGRHAPLFALLRAAVPLVKTFRFPEKLTPIVLAALSAAAALGWTAADRSWRRRGVLVAGGLLVLAAAAWLAAPAASEYGAAYLRDLSRSLLLASASLAVAAWLCGRRAWAAGALLLAAAEVTLGSRVAWDARPLADSASPPETVAALASLGVRPGEGRVTNFGFSGYPLDETELLTARGREWMDTERRGIFWSVGGWLGVESARLYMTPSPVFLAAETRPPAEFLLLLAPRFNVVAAFVPKDLSARLPELSAFAAFRGDLRLARLPDPWPRAYLAGAVAPGGTVPPILQVEKLAKGQAIVEGWTGSEPPANGSAEISHYSAGRVRVRVDSKREAFLVLNDLASAGWSATVSGRPAPIRTANAMVRAVRVPAGRSDVEFRYTVPGLAAGVWWFAVSLAVLLASLPAGSLWRWLGAGPGRAA